MQNRDTSAPSAVAHLLWLAFCIVSKRTSPSRLLCTSLIAGCLCCKTLLTRPPPIALAHPSTDPGSMSSQQEALQPPAVARMQTDGIQPGIQDPLKPFTL